MHLHTGTHMVAQLFGMSVNLDTIFTQWLTALIVSVSYTHLTLPTKLEV